MVEFALTIPILLALATAIFTFGLAFHSYLELTNAVNMGALVLAQSRGAADPCNAAAAQVKHVSTFLSKSNLTFNYTFYSTNFYNTSGATPTTLLTVSNATTCSPTATQMLSGGAVLLRVTYTLRPYGIFKYSFPGFTMGAQSVQPIQ
jgi:Flp pilus assembly protein TadG